MVRRFCRVFALLAILCFEPFSLAASGGGDPAVSLDPAVVPGNVNATDLARAIVAKERAAATAMGLLKELPMLPVSSQASPAVTGSGTTPPGTGTPVVGASPQPTFARSASPVVTGVPSPGQSAGPGPVTLRTALELFGPRTFNPAFTRDPGSLLIRHMTQTVLARPSGSTAGAYDPVLAESWKLSPDGTSFEIVLRPHLRWSDGEALTASDWTDAAALVYDDPLSLSLKIGDRFTWTAKDERTIVLSSAVPRGVEEYLRACERFPLPITRYKKWRSIGSPGSLGTGLRSVSEASRFMFFDSKPSDLAASGPWKVTEYVSGDHLRLVPNEYFDPGSLVLQPWPQGIAIDFAFVRDAEAAVAMVESGTLDVYGASADGLWSFFTEKQTKSARVLGEAEGPVLSIAFNTRPGSVFASPENRRFVASSLDRQEIAGKVLSGAAFPVFGLWANRVLAVGGTGPVKTAGRQPPATPAMSVSATAAAVTPAASAQVLRSFSLAYEKDNPSRELVAQYIARKLGEHGIEVVLHPMSFDAVVAAMAIAGEWQAALIGIDDSRDPQLLSPVWPELRQNGDTIPDIFVKTFREQFLVPLLRFRNLIATRPGSGLSPSAAAWLINRFQVAKREVM